MNIQVYAWLILGALATVIFLLVSLHRRLSLLERRLRSPRPDRGETTRISEEGGEVIDPASPYLQFLRENPEMEKLPKSEAAAAYRAWRKQNGLNWSNH